MNEVRWTGKDKISKAGQFVSMNDNPMINFNKTVFNGNETYCEWASPWKQDIPYAGGDNFFGADLKKDSVIKSYQSDFFRILDFKYDKDVKYRNHDLDVRR